MFLNNSWYVIAWIRDITDKPLAITVLEQSLVIFRDAEGQIGVLENRCPHRHVPLSLGCVAAGGIQCGYHGMVFDTNGRCLDAPSHGSAPPRARVRAYPSAERYGWVWAWMGDPAMANESSIPDFSKLDAPDYRAVGKTNHVLANYKLVTDNLMDLSHVGYVHQSTIGTPGFTEKGKLTSRLTEQGVQVYRTVPDVPMPPTYALARVLPEGRNIDRWQVIDFVAPCFVMIHVGGKEAGTGALVGDYEGGLNLWILNAMTPETENTTHYFWASVRAHDRDNEEVDALFLEQVSTAFDEDKVMLEAQQLVLNTHPETWDLALRSDAGAIQSRRVLSARIETEKSAARAAT